ncbi:flagellar biosynthetic protein FliO [Vampirovibrio sp.]|uniref:flagellar biosynthetic protein FliO n=1 Tax=Vampirovibrio sp. TaxID=2717857 RepID=UPI00359332EE
MENRIASTTLSVAKTSAPWAALYLAASLGLLLGAFNSGFAEPGNLSFVIEEIATQPETINPSTAPLNVEQTAPLPASTIAGTQSAVLTVSREIHTTAPIMNSAPKGVSSQKSPGNTGAYQRIVPTKPESRYYLQLPEPKTALQPSASSLTDNMPTTATSVPVAPVSPQLLSVPTEEAETGTSPRALPDPENQPLNLNTEQATVSGAATNALIRVTLGLMVVLGLLLLFAKRVLPRLMARHPEFFERLKQKNAPANALTPDTSVSYSAPLDIPQSVLAKQTSKKESLKQNWLGRWKQPQLATAKAPGSALESLEIQGKQFNLLSSTALGKDKELHLVGIMGRQLVVATTPYTVSLIQDLTETPQAETRPIPNNLNIEMAEADSAAAEALGSQLQLLGPNGVECLTTDETTATEPIPLEPEPIEATHVDEADHTFSPEVTSELTSELISESTSELTTEITSELTHEPEAVIIAQDLDDQPPPASKAEFIRAKSNPYNSVPRFSELRYLTIETTEVTPMPAEEEVPLPETVQALIAEALQQAQAQRSEIEPSTESPQPPKTSPALRPELESIVVLADYDDVYGY